MSFIVKKKIHGKEYFYLVKRKRVFENGRSKVKTKTIAYLGKDKKQAEIKSESILKEIEKITNKKDKKEKEIKKSFETGKRMEKEKNKEVKISIDELASFCKRKGFVYPSSEIYGGFSGFWDFGPLGVELFNNIRKEWWSYFVTQRENIFGLEASIISHPRTWKASGHLKSFSDVAVICKKCKKSTKVDKSEIGKVKCECGGEYEILGEFNLMFKTKVGALDAEDSYLRGETAQGMFMDFKLVQQTSRAQLPFGIAQIGRCFRNEISPRDFLFRSREFHIAEFEFFIHPEETKCSLLEDKHLKLKFKFLDSEAQEKNNKELKEVSIGDIIKNKKLGEWHAYWLAEQILWFNNLGLSEIKIREHTKDELSHYSSATFDIDYEYPFGSKEVAGIANRGQFDLIQHEKESKSSMEIFDEKSGKKIIPRVIEPTFGMERVFLAVLTKAYNYDYKRKNIVLKIPPKLSPIKAAVFPIVKQPEYEKISEEIVNDLRKEWNVVYDRSGSIGRRYARNDEIGTPFCITVDQDSKKNKDVTIRDRDSAEQVRIKIKDLKEIFRKLINENAKLTEFGKLVDTRKK